MTWRARCWDPGPLPRRLWASRLFVIICSLLAQVLFTKPGGMCWHAVECSSFVWVSRYQNKRFAGERLGNGCRSAVEGNRMGLRSILLAMLSFMLQVSSSFEQPLSSVLDEAPFASVFLSDYCTKVFTYLGAFGGATCKPLKLWSTAKSIRALRRAKPTPSPTKLFRTRPATIFGRKPKVDGLKRAMKSSSAYPQQFGAAVAQLL